MVQGKAKGYQDYRYILDNKDIDFVTIGTTDHWHTRIAIQAMQAGKDVYCEKPLTLTIEEGKQICKVTKETGRVFQVGTQQRTLNDFDGHRTNQEGRIGKVKRVTCNIGSSPVGGPFKSLIRHPISIGTCGSDKLHLWTTSRKGAIINLDGGMSILGGKMTDWGAHHVDIAQWAIQQNGEGQGVASLEPIMGEHSVPLENGMPTKDDHYNTSHKFHIRCKFSDKTTMNISHSEQGNGIFFEGTKGNLFVSRGKLIGPAVEELKEKPLSEETVLAVYKGKKVTNHMENFFECMKDRSDPILDVYTHHNAMTTCHLANISIRLGRKLKWNPKKEQIIGDDEANQWQAREQRKGFGNKHLIFV